MKHCFVNLIVFILSLSLHGFDGIGVGGAETSLSMLSMDMERTEADQKMRSDLIYKKAADGPLMLDLYYPSGSVPKAGYPLVVYTHGGGWAKGNKEIGDGWKRMMVDALTDKGFAVASVNYRLCTRDGRITMRECVIDSFDAVRFLAKHSDKLKLNPELVFSWGDSAGGHLAQMLCIASPEGFMGDPGLAEGEWRMVAGVSWYGPCDFEKSDLFGRPDGSGDAERFMDRLLRGDESPEARLAAIRELSPVNYLRADMSPLLMLQGDADPVIPVQHAHYMKERADAVGAPITKLIVNNASHGWNHRGEGAMSLSLEEVIDETVGFMVMHRSVAENVSN